MKHSYIKLVALITIGAFFMAVASCSKEPGTGGQATITGKVYAYDYNAYGDLVDSGYLGAENVYIAYGNHTNVDDNVKTSYNGEFKFEWLQKGDYTLWVYSKCDSCPFGDSFVTQKLTINKRKDDIVMPDFVVRK